MLLDTITPEGSSFYPKIILDYLKGKQELKPFYRFAHSEEAFDDVLQQRSFTPEKREALVSVLKEQYAQTGVDKKSPAIQQIESLLSPETFTVTTGHQLCLLTGPVYFIYKIAHTIRLAGELFCQISFAEDRARFWMASEDHDFEEIRSLVVDGEKFTWNKDSDHQPVGRLTVEGINEVLKDLEQHFAGSNEAPDFLKIAAAAYTNAPDLSVATRRLVHSLFGQYGLVILEPDHVTLKQELKKVMSGDIISNNSIDALNKTNGLLQKLKYKQQINGREINFFYLSEKGRRLILKDKNGYTVEETELHFTEKEMQEEIEKHPERFSPNVVLRPVYQECILPNLAYIGGPGELAYWLQLKGVFEAHGIEYPVVLLRNSFVLVSHAVRHKWEKGKMDPAVLFGRIDDLHVKVLDKLRPTSEKKVAADLDGILQQLIDETERVDNRLSAELIRYKKESAVFFDHFVKHVRDSKKDIYDAQLKEVYEVREAILPGGTPAERVSNIAAFARQNDTDAFIRFVLDHSEGITSSVKILAF